jgi:protein tyrosine/serine phosphatase
VVARFEDVTAPNWIDLDGAVNVRDLGGLPTRTGGTVARRRLIRSDNLQGLSSRDVALLVDEYGVRTVADLRTGVEVDSEGPGPLHDRPEVEIRHLSLFPEKGERTDAAATEPDAPVVLPWQDNEDRAERRRQGAAAVYLGYLEDRADSILESLRLIAGSPGATIVHCAAGKDRTGVVVALALDEVGVERDAIVADYARSAEVIEDIFDRLRSSRTYAGDMANADADKQAPRAATIEKLLEALDEQYGGASGWLRAHGWTDSDAAALRAKLLA